jgi:glycosyltransferase involved in cell wall biosynthesis
VAFAPGGLGTYEAGGVAAMAFLGVNPSLALAVVLTAHAIKTAYALLLGAVAAFLPGPGLFGRFQLERVPSPRPHGGVSLSPNRPIVLFMPAYNEAATVASVVARAPREVGGHPVIVMVIDDGSSDGTSDLASAAGAQVVRITPNRGLGAAVRTGLQHSLAHDPAAVAFCDADGEYAPEELSSLVLPILEDEADYVAGSRFLGRIERMHIHRRLGNVILTWLLSWVARCKISDGQTGYRAFSRQAAEAAEIIHDFNYAQVITLDLLAKGMRYVEVPISYSFRTTGESFVKIGQYLRSVVPAVYRELNAR